jgi:hypothetical protein
MTAAHLTERQEKWFASVRAGLERDTGRSLEEWVAIARTCPESAHRARLKWFKDTHGLLMNRASLVLGEAFGRSMAWDQPDALVDAVWDEGDARAIFEAVRSAAMDLPEVIMGPRKTFTAFSRKVQFCAARPTKTGALLGLCVPLDADPRLIARGNESWSERLPAKLALNGPDEVNEGVEALLRRAWAAS